MEILFLADSGRPPFADEACIPAGFMYRQTASGPGY